MRAAATGAMLSLAMGLGGVAAAQTAAGPALSQAAMVDRIVAQEHAFTRSVMRFTPRIETYIQEMGPNRDRGEAPTSDDYFLGKLVWGRMRSAGWMGPREVLFTGRNAGPIAHEFFPNGFAAMLSPDLSRFDQRHYRFIYEGAQFLGDVRCVMFNVAPRDRKQKGSFIGRIWANDRDFTIVRFDGTYIPNPHHKYVHFDSWRMRMGPGLWLPVAVYTQENDQRTGWFSHIAFKGETRLWGYALSTGAGVSGHGDLQVETAAVEDRSGASAGRTPLDQERAWELKAENDVLTRMQQAGLLAPPGPVDQVLETVVNNLEVTNKLSIDPPVRCRVMLTTPLAAFAVGHTIVVSRGLIDVLPDEASLAMMLAHELGAIALNQGINTDYAFDDRMMFPDVDSFARLQMTRPPAEDAAADAKGLELLENSPYQNKLAEAGLFLEALQHAAKGLPNLLSPHMGNALVLKGRVDRMQALLARAPQLQVRNLKQIAALPLGARLQLNPWNDRLTLSQAPAERLLSARDKLSFEITPYMPYLSWGTRKATAVAEAGTAAAHPP